MCLNTTQVSGYFSHGYIACDVDTPHSWGLDIVLKYVWNVHMLQWDAAILGDF
jgi:hypothetical protein